MIEPAQENKSSLIILLYSTQTLIYSKKSYYSHERLYTG